MKYNTNRKSGYDEVKDDSYLKTMSRKEVLDLLRSNDKALMAAQRSLSLSIRHASENTDHPEYIIDALKDEKKIIDTLSESLVAVTAVKDTRIAKQLKVRLDAEIRRYNDLVEDYEQATGGTLTKAKPSLAEDIMAERDYDILPELSYTTQSADDYGDTTENINVISRKEFSQYASETDRAMAAVVREYNKKVANIDATDGQDKVIMILNAINLKKQLIDANTELLIASRRASSTKDISLAKRRIYFDLQDYNMLVDRYKAFTGNELTRPSKTYIDDIMSGKPYSVLPTITYTVTDGAENEEVEYDVGKRRAKNRNEGKEAVVASALEAKVNEQADKDVSVLEAAANFEANMIASELDMNKNRFGDPAAVSKKSKKARRKEIQHILDKAKVGADCEKRDNDRYYAVVLNDPETMRTKKKKPNRQRIAALRSEMITLLNKRDEINGQLISIYSGYELNSDGTSVNETWRKVKDNAAQKILKCDKKIAKKVSKLPATPDEKQKIFAVMNHKIDAASSMALCQYRLSHEKLSKQDKKAIKQDVHNYSDIMKRCDKDVDYMVNAVRKRANATGDGSWFSF